MGVGIVMAVADKDAYSDLQVVFASDFKETVQGFEGESIVGFIAAGLVLS